MRKFLITGAAAAVLFSAASVPALAGGVANSAVDPDTIVEPLEAAGSLGAPVGLAIIALVVGAVVVSGDSE